MKLLQNNILKIRALEPTDLDYFYQCENNTQNWDTSNVYAPVSRYTLYNYIQQQPADVFEAVQLKWVITLADGTPVGMVELNNIDHFNKRAEVGIFIEAAHRKKGYATQTLQLIIAYAKQYIGWHQLTAIVAQKNTASHQLFRGVGFVQSGEFVDYFKTETGFENAWFYQLVL